MAKRAVSEQTVELFKEYGKTMGQRFKRDEGLDMLTSHFNLTEPEASAIFEFFDSDNNGELSCWEFQHFYDNLGPKARPMMDLFKGLEQSDGSGNVDMAKAFDTLLAMRKEGGLPVQEAELANALKAYAGEEKRIDLTKFINLMCCLKLDIAHSGSQGK
ncbi:hypothetical protein ACOMHN_013935 [Nucella lapillus]